MIFCNLVKETKKQKAEGSDDMSVYKTEVGKVRIKKELLDIFRIIFEGDSIEGIDIDNEKLLFDIKKFVEAQYPPKYWRKDNWNAPWFYNKYRTELTDDIFTYGITFNTKISIIDDFFSYILPFFAEECLEADVVYDIDEEGEYWLREAVVLKNNEKFLLKYHSYIPERLFTSENQLFEKHITYFDRTYIIKYSEKEDIVNLISASDNKIIYTAKFVTEISELLSFLQYDD